MKWTGLNELREKYLSFFESKGHLRHKSFPLVPVGDKSILLINAGMTPLKKYFTGELEPPRHRMTTCQKCIRTPDIERVGITARHGTYFEMLGNFSFGDYFKEEVIPWAWEFCTEILELPKEKLWVTVYQEDDEAYDIWNQKVGVPAEHIVRLGKEDNFWEHGSGPCGPCSEIYFDRGEAFGCGSPDCKPGCDCDRFMEFWNLVFTQFDGDGHGGYERLAKPNIDTGMGLERIACLMQGVNNLFEVDTVRNIMLAISEKAGVVYGKDSKTDISLRVITDHIRSTVFLVCDGVMPSNEGRGYVLRRLLRRAARHGRLLGIQGTFLADIVPIVARENFSEYPELTEKLDYIRKVISMEEMRFASTIDSGLDILRQVMEQTKADGKNCIDGKEVFRLNDTFGFPIDLTREIAAEEGLSIDEEGYHACMAEQKARARSARKAMGDLGWTSDAMELLDGLTKTEFTGYQEEVNESQILALIDPQVNELVGSAEGGSVIVILNRTPFYGEGGGQIGDTGMICGDGVKLRVTDTKKNSGIYLHICELEEGSVHVGMTVTAAIDSARRAAICRNHSATHLMQAALREVLGNHVEQAGSYVTDECLRFDFSHFQAVTREELQKVEQLVNREILRGSPITTTETDIETARSMGAMALFGEKYGAVVRMVRMGDYSCELCGGTHLDQTSKAGLFHILSESSVAAGVRRIEATTGWGVLKCLYTQDEQLGQAARELKTMRYSELGSRAAQLQTELKAAKQQAEALGAQMASMKTAGFIQDAVSVGSLRIIARDAGDMTQEAARAACDEIRNAHDEMVVLLSVANGEKRNLVCACGKTAVAAGVHAGNLVRQVAAFTGGKGGGRPDSAVGGIGEASKLSEALAAAKEMVASMIKNTL